jgi:hypothetical protein
VSWRCAIKMTIDSALFAGHQRAAFVLMQLRTLRSLL